MRWHCGDLPTLVEGVAREEEGTRPRRVNQPARPRGSRSWPQAPLLGAVALRWLSAPRLKSCPQGQPPPTLLPSGPTPTNKRHCPVCPPASTHREVVTVDTPRVSAATTWGGCPRGVERFGQYLPCGCRGEGGLVARRSLGGPPEFNRGEAKLPAEGKALSLGMLC